MGTSIEDVASSVQRLTIGDHTYSVRRICPSHKKLFEGLIGWSALLLHERNQSKLCEMVVTKSIK